MDAFCWNVRTDKAFIDKHILCVEITMRDTIIQRQETPADSAAGVVFVQKESPTDWVVPWINHLQAAATRSMT